MSAETETAAEESIAAAELRDLKRTVTALRDTLEAHHAESARAVQAAVAAAHNEIGQLKATVASLREALETAHQDKVPR